MKATRKILLTALLFWMASCSNHSNKHGFGQMPDPSSVDLVALTNANGMQVSITAFGATVQSLTAPGRDGRFEDVVLGFENVDGYLAGHPYFGAIVGRYGNRIAKGRFTLDGIEYTLATNNGDNHLHGGSRGFDKVKWSMGAVNETENSVTLTYVSPNGEEGYPGEVSLSVTYTLTDDNSLRIDYEGTTSAPTHLNMTNHSYFNLAGQSSGDILEHAVEIAADRFTPVDSGLIPSGELRRVEGTAFDFRQARTIGSRIGDADEQLEFARGYDHNWVLNRAGEGLQLAARVYEPGSGRIMEVLTTEPGMQFYTGNFLDGSHVGKEGAVYDHRSAFCMETQHFPDTPNQPDFPSTVLRPGETYATTTIYRFTTPLSRRTAR
jgi:aldose 1-epimerase